MAFDPPPHLDTIAAGIEPEIHGRTEFDPKAEVLAVLKNLFPSNECPECGRPTIGGCLCAACWAEKDLPPYRSQFDEDWLDMDDCGCEDSLDWDCGPGYPR
jgi:hypothetical protein